MYEATEIIVACINCIAPGSLSACSDSYRSADGCSFGSPQMAANSISGLTNEVLDVWLEEEWLIPTESPTEVTFSEVDVARARLIRDLQQDLGVNTEGVSVILSLLDQLHGMRRTLVELRHNIQTRSD
jgi:chaperone modulatory protein CbpM